MNATRRGRLFLLINHDEHEASPQMLNKANAVSSRLVNGSNKQ
jgi:hypothetical protein